MNIGIDKSAQNLLGPLVNSLMCLFTDRLAQLVECRTTEREVSGTSFTPDQHSES